MHHSSVWWEITLLYFFCWNFVSFGQKKPVKAHLKFHQIYTLIGPSCWNYVKFQLKKYKRVMSHDTEKWCKIWRKVDLLLQKRQEFGEFWPKYSKVSKICFLTGSFCAKYITFHLKTYRGVIFHDNEEWCKLEEKLNCGLENDMMNLGNFNQNAQKPQNWWSHFILSWCKTWRGIDFHFKINMKNLRNFDLSTQKSQEFAL